MPLIKTVQPQIDHALTGEAFRAKRHFKKKSLHWLAKAMGISVPYLSDLERGRRNWDEELAKKADAALK